MLRHVFDKQRRFWITTFLRGLVYWKIFYIIFYLGDWEDKNLGQKSHNLASDFFEKDDKYLFKDRNCVVCFLDFEYVFIVIYICTSETLQTCV